MITTFNYPSEAEILKPKYTFTILVNIGLNLFFPDPDLMNNVFKAKVDISGPLRSYILNLETGFPIEKYHEICHLIVELIFQIVGLEFAKYGQDYSETLTFFIQDLCEVDAINRCMIFNGMNDNIFGYTESQKNSISLSKSIKHLKSIAPEFLTLFLKVSKEFQELFQGLFDLIIHFIISNNNQGGIQVAENIVKNSLFTHEETGEGTKINIKVDLPLSKINEFRKNNVELITALKQSMETNLNEVMALNRQLALLVNYSSSVLQSLNGSYCIVSSLGDRLSPAYMNNYLHMI
jgi:hypothetical protein